MIKYPFLIFFLLYSFCVKAGIVFSDVKKSGPSNVVTTVLKKSQKGVYILRQKPNDKIKNIDIDLYSELNGLQLIKTKKFLISKEEFLIQLYPSKNGFYLFYGKYNPTNKRDYFYMKKINENLESVKKDSLMLILKDEDINISEIFISSNIDLTKFAIFYPDFEKKQDKEIHIRYFDSSASFLNEQVFNFQAMKDYLLVDVGYLEKKSVLMFKSKELDENEKYLTLKLFQLNKESNEIIPIEIEDDSTRIKDCLLKTDHILKRIIIGGLYTKNDRGIISGFFYVNVPDSEVNLPLRHLPFKEQIQKNGIIQNSIDQDFYTTRTTDIISTQNKGIIFACEESRSIREIVPDITINGFTQTSYRYYFIYNSINLIHFGENGNEIWQTSLKKEQATINDYGNYSSYVLQKQKDKLIFLYNDFSRAKEVLSAFVVFGNGTYENKILIRSHEYKYKLIPREGGQLGSEEMIIPGISSRGPVLMKIKF